MSDKSQDELRKRFDRSQNRETKREDSADEAHETTTSDSSDPSERGEINETDEIDQTDDTNERGETDKITHAHEQPSEGLKERKQVAMYLPPDLRGELSGFYDELDARATLAGDGGLQKNREFYEGMVEFVLDHRQAFADSLGIEIDNE